MTHGTLIHKGFFVPWDYFKMLCSYLETDDPSEEELTAYKSGLLHCWPDTEDEQEAIAGESFSHAGGAALLTAKPGENPYQVLLDCCTEVRYTFRDGDHTGFVFDYRNIFKEARP